MEDYIWTIDKVISNDFCDELRAFLDRFDLYAERAEYGEGESTDCRELVLYEQFEHRDLDYLREHQAILLRVMGVLSELVKSVVSSHIVPLSWPLFSPVHLRKMLGPTRIHFDNVSPFVFGKSDDLRIASRVVTFILTLSDSKDELVFPRHNRVVPLKKGSAILFPPYWMFDHYTQGFESGQSRYSMTTWLYETSPLMVGESLPITGRLSQITTDRNPHLLHLPETIRRKWWDLAAEELLSDSKKRSGFESFLKDFKSFAQLRGLDVSERYDFDVMALVPGPAKTSETEPEHIVSLFNLGDKPTQVQSGSDTFSLNPGDGCWAKNGTPLRIDRSSLRNELEVLLVMKAPANEF